MADQVKVTVETRHLWHQLSTPSGGPFYYALLSDDQRHILRDWLEDTGNRNMIGETSVSAIGMLAGLILGNRINRVAQCGHYAGFSLLVLAMLMKQARIPGRLVSVDVDQNMTDYTRSWIERAGLTDIATALVLDSGDPFAAHEVTRQLGGSPSLVFIDSSHQYRHTLEELDLWSRFVAPRGFICLHDVSDLSRSFDANGLGGVPAALEEWLPKNPNVSGITVDPGSHHAEAIYLDPCGFGLLQVRDVPPGLMLPRPESKRLIADSYLAYRDNWQLGDGFIWGENGVAKEPGASTAISCFSPVVSGERYHVVVELEDVRSGGLHACAGGGPLGDFFSRDGISEGYAIAGAENALIGLLASSDFQGRLVSFTATLVP